MGQYGTAEAQWDEGRCLGRGACDREWANPRVKEPRESNERGIAI